MSTCAWIASALPELQPLWIVSDPIQGKYSQKSLPDGVWTSAFGHQLPICYRQPNWPRYFSQQQQKGRQPPESIMTHENEYHDNMIALLELIWGEGYMAPGGPGNVAKLLRGLETRGKRILDIGCGIGGPALEMVQTFGAEVVGIDLEAPLIERAVDSAKRGNLSERCDFRTVEAGPLQLPAESFDIVVSSGAITQTPDTTEILGECFRVLRPGGCLTCYEWMKSGDAYSDDMLYWLKLEGLTYALKTLQDYAEYARECGFVDIRVEDASGWYRTQVHREYELLKGELYPRMVELIGQKDADHFVENWRAMTIVCDKGEMRQGYFRGYRPA